MKLAHIAPGVVLMIGLAATLRPPASIWNLTRDPHPQTVTLAWSNSPDPTVVYYNLYQGGAARVYTNFYAFIFATNYTITNPGQGVFHFAATAVNTVGLESDYSNEAIWTNLPPPPVTNFLLSVTILQSPDLTNWTTFTNLSPVQATNSGQPVYWRALMNIQPQ